MLLEVLDRQLQQDSGMPHGYYEILVRPVRGRRVAPCG